MKDILLTAKGQKTEIRWFAGCFCCAVMLNVFSIILYQTSWKELYSQLLWVAIITGVLYAISVVIRVCLYLLKRLLTRKR